MLSGQKSNTHPVFVSGVPNLLIQRHRTISMGTKRAPRQTRVKATKGCLRTLWQDCQSEQDLDLASATPVTNVQRLSGIGKSVPFF